MPTIWHEQYLLTEEKSFFQMESCTFIHSFNKPIESRHLASSGVTAYSNGRYDQYKFCASAEGEKKKKKKKQTRIN